MGLVPRDCDVIGPGQVELSGDSSVWPGIRTTGSDLGTVCFPNSMPLLSAMLALRVSKLAIQVLTVFS